jgi:hypothetical protein
MEGTPVVRCFGGQAKCVGARGARAAERIRQNGGYGEDGAAVCVGGG